MKGSKVASEAVQRAITELSPGKQGDGKLYLADLLAAGKEVPQDMAAAMVVLEDLVRSGSASATMRLAKIYMNGWGVPKDPAKAAQYCNDAAKKKFPPAMVCLGYLNASGMLGDNRDKEAFDWYEKAARTGSPIALYSLGTMYAQGKGTKQDLEQAYICLSAAVEARLGVALPLFQSLAERLGPERIKKIANKVRSQRDRYYAHILDTIDLEFGYVIKVDKLD
jgi:hypothetical protein